MSTFTPPTQRKEYRLENYRTCEICGDAVNCDTDGMIAHMQANHTLEEIATEISRPWSPNEAHVFHHPNGTVHMFKSGGDDLVTTMCGREISKHAAAPDESMEEWFERMNYEHADEDDYCGSCVKLHKQKFPESLLPEPVRDD